MNLRPFGIKYNNNNQLLKFLIQHYFIVSISNKGFRLFKKTLGVLRLIQGGAT